MRRPSALAQAPQLLEGVPAKLVRSYRHLHKETSSTRDKESKSSFSKGSRSVQNNMCALCALLQTGRLEPGSDCSLHLDDDVYFSASHNLDQD